MLPVIVAPSSSVDMRIRCVFRVCGWRHVFIAWNHSYKWCLTSKTESAMHYCLVDTVRIVCGRVCVTIRCLSVRPSVHLSDPSCVTSAVVRRVLLLWARRAGDFDCQRRTLDSSGVAARVAAQRSATNASSVTFAADVGGLVHTASRGLSLCLLCDHDHPGVVCRSDRRLGELFHAQDGERDRGALCWAAEEPRSHVHRQNALMSPWAWLLSFTVQRVENVFHRRDHQCERL